jgi:hypothetical protein
MGLQEATTLSLDHHGRDRVRWSARNGSRWLLYLLVRTFGAGGNDRPYVIDATGKRRGGPSGVRCIVLTLVMTPPGRNGRGCLGHRASFSPSLNDRPRDLRRRIVHRWPIEMTFEERRAPLGLEPKRPWTLQW